MLAPVRNRIPDLTNHGMANPMSQGIISVSCTSMFVKTEVNLLSVLKGLCDED